MKLHLWGTDFRRGDASLRRALYIAPEDRPRVLKDILALGFTDVVYVNTCNRTEFYTSAESYYADTRGLWIKLLAYFGIDEDAYYRGYHLEGKSALRHLLRVSSSLESLVLGEPQILGQVKEAHRLSQSLGIPLDSSLDQAFQLAFETAKRIRTQTAIGQKPVSVAALGLQRVKSLLDSYPLTQAVVVGRSPMTQVVVQWLQKNHR